MGMLTKYIRMYAEKRLCQNGKKKDRLCTVLRGLRYSLNVIEDCKYLLQTKQNQALSQWGSQSRGDFSHWPSNRSYLKQEVFFIGNFWLTFCQSNQNFYHSFGCSEDTCYTVYAEKSKQNVALFSRKEGSKALSPVALVLFHSSKSPA